MLLQTKNLIVSLLISNLTVFAQTDSLFHKRKWYLPTGITIEYAGGFGMLSAGGLFTPLKKTEVGITVGYTPPSYGNIWTANVLVSYTTFRIKLNKQFTFYPLKVGAFVNFNFGKNSYLKWPSNYPDNHYWWISAMRYGPFVDMELKYTPWKRNLGYVFFFQCLMNDLYIHTYVHNTRFISLGDILVLGMGVKFIFKPTMNY